jgi:hypothetical protein
LAVHQPSFRDPLLACLDPVIDRRILETLVTEGPAVDGVTLGCTMTIDGFDLAVHQAKLEQVRDCAAKTL